MYPEGDGPLKIALVSSKYPPDVGGGETHIRDLVVGLAARGHHLSLLTGTPSPTDSDGAYSIDSLPLLGDFGRGAGTIRELLPSIYDWLMDVDADVVHVFNHLPTLAVGLVRRGVRAPLAISLFETLEPDVRVFDLWRRFDLEAAMQEAILAVTDYDAWICGSEAYLSWARRAGASESRLWYAPFCVDRSRFRPASAVERAAARRDNGIESDRVVLGFPSRLVPRKRFEDLVHGLAELRRGGGPRPLLLIPRPTATSDPAYIATITDLIAELDVSDQCRFTHRDYDVNTMPAFYAACDYAVQPAGAEGLGIALLEAMAMRIPVLCSRVDGHTEVVGDGVTGFLFEAHDPHDVAVTIKRALLSETRQILDEATSLVAEKFSQRAMLDGHLAAYRHIHRQRRAGQPEQDDGRALTTVTRQAARSV